MGSSPVAVTKFFTENLLAREIKKKRETLLNKPVHLGLSVLKLN